MDVLIVKVIWDVMCDPLYRVVICADGAVERHEQLEEADVQRILAEVKVRFPDKQIEIEMVGNIDP